MRILGLNYPRKPRLPNSFLEILPGLDTLPGANSPPGRGYINNNMKNYITDFKRFALTESATNYADQMELHRLGIPIPRFRVLIVRVDWERIGQKRFDGTVEPFMKCWFMEAYPAPNEDGEDSWVEYPPAELVRMVKEDEPGDVEFVDGFIMDLAIKNDVDLIWELGDKTWREVPSGRSVPRLDLLR